MPSLRRSIAADHPAFAGHFPGRPILPGVVLLGEVMEAIRLSPGCAAAIGAEPVLVAAKFIAPVISGADLQIELHLDGERLGFVVTVDAGIVARGQFQARRQAAVPQ